MNTVTLSADAYQQVLHYAEQQHTSVDEVLNRLVLTFIVGQPGNEHARPAFRLKTEQELSPVVKDLIGIASEGAHGADAKEARMAYLEEKYGL